MMVPAVGRVGNWERKREKREYVWAGGREAFSVVDERGDERDRCGRAIK